MKTYPTLKEVHKELTQLVNLINTDRKIPKKVIEPWVIKDLWYQTEDNYRVSISISKGKKNIDSKVKMMYTWYLYLEYPKKLKTEDKGVYDTCADWEEWVEASRKGAIKAMFMNIKSLFELAQKQVAQGHTMN